MKNSIQISFGTLDDIDEILPLFDLYRQFYGEPSRLNQSRFFLQQRLLLGESHLVIAKYDNKVVGFTQLFPSFSSVTLQRLWILNDLYVAKDKRGLGIGYELLKAAKDFGFKSGAKQIFIEGAIENVKACNLYESVGFIRNSEYNYYHLPLFGKEQKELGELL